MLKPSWFSRIRQLQPYLITVALLVLVAANFSFAVRAIGDNDFLPGWVAARAWLTSGTSPYDPSVAVETQEMIYGRPANAENDESLALFLYPLWAMLLYIPLSLAPYPLALALWMTILELGLPLVVWMCTRLMRWRVSPRVLIGMMLFSIFNYHGIRAIVTGQFAVVEAILVVGTLLAIRDRRDVLGGILLGLSLTKPHVALPLVLFVTLWSISTQRWRLLAVTLVTPLLLLGLTLLLSRGWVLMWLRSLTVFAQAVDFLPPLLKIGVDMGAAGFWTALALSIALLIYMVVEWWLALEKEEHWFHWTAAITLVITSLITIRTSSANMVLLIPALVLILKIWLDRSKGKGSLPAFVFGMLVMIGIWALFIFTSGQRFENPYLFLLLPLVALFGLLWSRWWVVSGPGAVVDSDLLVWD
jgi:hypothetical protein